eukprot:scaffold96440_cov21-Tisochrysis_lutea.AAC.3
MILPLEAPAPSPPTAGSSPDGLCKGKGATEEVMPKDEKRRIVPEDENIKTMREGREQQGRSCQRLAKLAQSIEPSPYPSLLA